jgi:hypothetical protein
MNEIKSAESVDELRNFVDILASLGAAFFCVDFVQNMSDIVIASLSVRP